MAPPSDGNPLLFLPVWGLCFLPYVAACAIVLMSRPPAGRWSWIELGVLGLGAALFRLLLLPLPPGLSRDVWRYLWDARVVTHGYSPYVYPPGARALDHLRNVLFFNCRFRNIPTDYPPGAEGIFLLGYRLDPTGLAGIKAVFLAFDLITCGALAWLIRRRGLDPRRAVVYAWCPLPIVEFAIEGHLDVIAIAFTLLAALTATDERRGGRILAGFFLAAATLTRLYPILALPLLLRRRDPWLPVTFAATLALGYLPFILLGHGQVLGFLLSYTGQQGGNAGLVQAGVRRVSAAFGLGAGQTLDLEYGTDAALLAAVEMGVLVLRRRGLIGIDLGFLVPFGAIFTVSSHVFPWYVTALLPWVALSIQPVRRSRQSVARTAAVALSWCAACTALVAYTRNVSGLDTAPWWAGPLYAGHGVMGILVAGAAILLVYARLSSARVSHIQVEAA